MENESLISDFEPSVPRTPTQSVLRVVSLLMGILGGILLAVAGDALVLGPDAEE